MTPEISLVIPVHNEAGIIENTVERASKALNGTSFEIILVEDGSIDRSRKKVSDLGNQDNVKSLTSEKRLGKGKAISKGFEHSSGDILVFIDADLSVPVDQLMPVIEAVRDGNDIVVGSRRDEKSIVERGLTRKTGTFLYNEAVKFLLGSDIDDHQCGFKAFRSDCYRQLEGNVDAEGFFWDTEMLIEAQRRGLKVKEVPVNYISRSNGSFRPFRDLPDFFLGLIRELS